MTDRKEWLAARDAFQHKMDEAMLTPEFQQLARDASRGEGHTGAVGCLCARCVERRRRCGLIRKLDLPLDAIMARFGVSNGEAVRLRREAKA